MKKIEFKNFPGILSLHDCKTKSVEYIDNKLIFYFDKEKVSEATLKQLETELLPSKILKVSYILSEDFFDEKLFPAVKHINRNSFLRRSAIQLWRLPKLINYLNIKNYSLIFYDHYFNNRNCMLFVELVKGDDHQLGNWFEIDLLIDEIDYEWT